jgi:hypothetical protein
VHARGPAAELLDAYERSLDERAGTPQPLDGGGFRKGTGGVLLTAITCRGTEGSPLGSTVQGGALTVGLDYCRTSADEQAHFSVSLRRVGSDSPLVDLTTESSGAGPVPLTARGSVTIVLDRVDLEPGAYWVDAGIYSADWEVPLDYRWDSTRVVVAGRSRGGRVQPPHRWTAS